MKYVSAAIGVAIVLLAPIPGDAKQARSYTAKAEFKRLQPCPANENKRGPCPGYEIDHATPLKCGGPDNHSNMQWLTVEQHREKTRRESGWCRR